MPLSKSSIIACERGSYSLLRKISEGGMGLVWLARSVDSNRQLIVKEAFTRNADRRIPVERLKFECAVLRSINDEADPQTSDSHQQLIHQHVVRYVDSLDNPTNPLLVLEFVEGDIMNEMFKGPPAAENMALHYAATLLKVVAALHLRGIVHRDISPSNIILNQKRRLVLIDFGTCQTLHTIAGTSPRYGKAIMKRGFSAPEMLHEMSDERSDIFSVGATLFYLLTGRNPADFMSNVHTMTTNLHSLNKGVAKIISDIVEIAMSADPDQRFQSANAMSTAIEEGSRLSLGPKI
ncbi:MAG: serine/threonine-protein kinase [Candidatus Bathyarchaeia archaeon]